ncbi:hypothetical protein TSUD_308150 [Trifolium subterraneum]|nr:hypothetical protein TSUD_308150 [Trifolium subterraneum]
MDRLRPRNRPVFSGFTNSEIVKMEKLLTELKGQPFTQDFYQKLAKSFNISSGRAGKPVIKWTEVTAFSLPVFFYFIKHGDTGNNL